MAATCLIHILIGGPDANAPARGSDLPEIARATVHVAWHIVSLTLAVIAAAHSWPSRHEDRALEIMLAALQLRTAAIFLWAKLTLFGRHPPRRSGPSSCWCQSTCGGQPRQARLAPAR